MRPLVLAAMCSIASAFAACGDSGSSEGSASPEEQQAAAASGGEARGEGGGSEGGADGESGGSAQAALVRSMALPEGPDGTAVCSLANGDVRWLLPVPDGFISLAIEGRCHLTTQDERTTMMVDAVAVGDAGPERELAIEPDGVRRWAAAGFAPSAVVVADGTIEIAGAATHWYRLRTTAGEPAAPMEILLLRRTIGGHHVIVMVAIKEGARWTWDDASDWIASIRPAG